MITGFILLFSVLKVFVPVTSLYLNGADMFIMRTDRQIELSLKENQTGSFQRVISYLISDESILYFLRYVDTFHYQRILSEG